MDGLSRLRHLTHDELVWNSRISFTYDLQFYSGYGKQQYMDIHYEHHPLGIRPICYQTITHADA